MSRISLILNTKDKSRIYPKDIILRWNVKPAIRA